MKTISVLSIRQPWAWLITHGFKDIENREWPTPFRGRLLIHVGKQGDPLYFERNGRFHGDAFARYLRNKGWTGMNAIEVPATGSEYDTGGIVGIATLVDCVTRSPNPWFIQGQYGFVLKDARPLPRIPLRGQPGIFQVSLDDILFAVKEIDPTFRVDW